MMVERSLENASREYPTYRKNTPLQALGRYIFRLDRYFSLSLSEEFEQDTGAKLRIELSC